MRHAWLRPLVILLALMAGAKGAEAQGPPGQVPVFAGDPKPAPAPEFCPPAPEPVIYRTPFDGLENPKPNAFTEPCEDGPGIPHLIYFGIGALALQRESLSDEVIAVFDPGVNIPGVPANVDTGNLPPVGAPIALRYNAVPRRYQWGAQLTLGMQHGPHALELHGYYLESLSNGRTITAPGQLDLPFANFPTPLGFEGNNFLWLQADQVTVELQTRLANVELNYRYLQMPQFEWLLGVRCVNLQEMLRIITDDDSVVAQPRDPLRRATYQVDTDNQLVGAQVGFEASLFLAEKWSFGLSNKTMVGPNFFDVENRLIRGDGFERTPGRRSDTNLGGLVEVNLFTTIWFSSNMRLKAGYQALWIFNVPEAEQQVNFDPSLPLGTVNDNGSVFFHGPRIEFQFAF